MYQPLSLVCMGILILCLLGQTTEAKGINPFCRTSDDKGLCNTMVLGAKNLHQATKKSVQSALTEATALQKLLPLIDQALAGLAPDSKASALSTCRDNFDGAVDSLKEALDFIDKNDMGGLNSYLSAAENLGDCTDAFEQFGHVLPPDVAKNMDTLTKQVSNCLAVSQQI